MKFGSGIILDIIGYIDFIYDINKILLTIIILSIGNTLGDFFSNGNIAKSGFEKMAIFGTYSSQLFNGNIGFSSSLLMQLIKGNKIEFDLFNLSNYNCRYLLFTYIFLIAYVILNIIYLSINKFRINKKIYYFYFGFYLVYLVGIFTIYIFFN